MSTSLGWHGSGPGRRVAGGHSGRWRWARSRLSPLRLRRSRTYIPPTPPVRPPRWSDAGRIGRAGRPARPTPTSASTSVAVRVTSAAGSWGAQRCRNPGRGPGHSCSGLVSWSTCPYPPEATMHRTNGPTLARRMINPGIQVVLRWRPDDTTNNDRDTVDHGCPLDAARDAVACPGRWPRRPDTRLGEANAQHPWRSSLPSDTRWENIPPVPDARLTTDACWPHLPWVGRWGAGRRARRAHPRSGYGGMGPHRPGPPPWPSCRPTVMRPGTRLHRTLDPAVSDP